MEKLLFTRRSVLLASLGLAVVPYVRRVWPVGIELRRPDSMAALLNGMASRLSKLREEDLVCIVSPKVWADLMADSKWKRTRMQGYPLAPPIVLGSHPFVPDGFAYFGDFSSLDLTSPVSVEMIGSVDG